MSQYYNNQPPLPQMNAINPAENVADVPVLSEFDKLRETLLTADAEEGWAPSCAAIHLLCKEM